MKKERTEYDELVDRIKDALNVDSDSDLSEVLHVKPQSVSNWRRGEGPSKSRLSSIAGIAKVSLDWLQKGIGTKEQVYLGRAIEATDSEIIECFELDELRALREISMNSGVVIPDVIAQMTKESLISRGLIKVPAQLLIESIASYPDKSQQYRCVILGEIQDDNSYHQYASAQTAQIPKHFNPQENKDEFIHPGHFHAYRIMTEELTEEGLHKNDLVICVSAQFSAPLQDSQPVVLPIESKSKMLIRRFYRDLLDPNQFVFRPIKGNRPIIRLKSIRYVDMDAVLGIVTP